MRYMFSSVKFFNFKNYLIIEYVYGNFMNEFRTFLTHSSPLSSPVSLSLPVGSFLLPDKPTPTLMSPGVRHTELRTPCTSIGRELFTGVWAAHQRLHHCKKCLLGIYSLIHYVMKQLYWGFQRLLWFGKSTCIYSNRVTVLQKR